MTHEQAWEEARKRWPPTGTTLDAEGQTEGWAEERHGMFVVGVRRFRANNVVEPEFTSYGAGTSYEAAFDAVDLTALVKFSGRLQYLSHDARDVIERSGRVDDLTLFYQVQFILLCCNFGAEHVLRYLKPIVSCTEETGTFMEGSVGMSDAPFATAEPSIKRLRKKRGVTSEQAAYANSKTLMQILNPTEKDVKDGMRGLSFRLKTPIRNVTLSARAIRNLYLVDQRLLAADWTVRIEVLARLFDQVTEATMGDIVAECSYPRMSGVLADVEVYLSGVRQSAQELQEARDVVPEPARPVSDKVVKAFEDALKEFKECRGPTDEDLH